MRTINGFLHTNGKNIVNGSGEVILLTGWGLGNWLVQEGYMWLSGSNRFDRPHRIRRVVEELTGKEYAEKFWKRFFQNYITREDILYMAELGYNSVRIPMNWRDLMEEGPGIIWKEDGFVLLDQCLEWCEEAGIYAFLDLHAAPGGQTGANIDDSIDNVPRLFIDSDSKEKAIALWVKIAERYRDREAVGGYDFLNEPIAPPSAGYGDNDYLIPRLEQFYRDVIAAVRAVDTNHMLSIEGPHWATDCRIFEEKYDDNMVLHFHRYAEPPERKILQKFIDKAEEWNIPLWMGETAENLNEWYAALYPLAESLGIGYNLWPWKKMECTNSPCSIRKPIGYEEILRYTEGGPHPGFERAQQILDEYLELIKLENCVLHPEVTKHVFRQAPFSVRATDFDEVGGKGVSYSGNSSENLNVDYRRGCGMQILEDEPEREKRFAFDCGWDRFALLLQSGEFAEYTFDGCGGMIRLEVFLSADKKSVLQAEIKAGDMKVAQVYENDDKVSFVFDVSSERKQILRLTALSGELMLKKIQFLK